MMFIHDKPIVSAEKDFLGRKGFSKHLGEALCSWEENESFVISLSGKWGTGKTSIINLALEHINNHLEDEISTIIRFNPWSISEEDNLNIHFFNELSAKIKGESTKNNIKLANKLKKYADILSIAPTGNNFANLLSNILIVLGIVGLSASQVLQLFNLPENWVKSIVFILFLLLLVLGISKNLLFAISNIILRKSNPSIEKIKSEIVTILEKSNKKILIIIDDIDRLNKREIRKIMRLIKVNADFPNTLYLLAFDNQIVEQCLNIDSSISGREYLSKIVNVNFDVPMASMSSIHDYLLKELDKIVKTLSPEAESYFNEKSPRWTNMYHSGFKDYFNTLRDVKRYLNSLKFNINLMSNNGILEVNPIDFFAIEIIRIFNPKFYSFVKKNKSLFTVASNSYNSEKDDKSKKEEIDRALNDELSHRSSLVEMIKRLFPHIRGILGRESSEYGDEWQTDWRKELRVCATDNFDTYFSLIPGGGIEISHYETQEVLNSSDNVENFEKILRKYLENERIEKLLSRLQDYTSEEKYIPQANISNFMIGLFNVSDELPDTVGGFYSLDPEMHLARIVYQLLKRNKNKNKNYLLLKESILSSKGLYGPLHQISLEKPKKDKENTIPSNKHNALKKMGVEKICKSTDDEILNNRHLLDILAYWKIWDGGKQYLDFTDKIQKNIQDSISIIDKYIRVNKSQGMGDYGMSIERKISFQAMSYHFDLNVLKSNFEKEKNNKSNLYLDNKDNIDNFLDNFTKTF